MNFLNNPRYNALKVILLILIIFIAGRFILYHTVFRPGINQALIIDDIGGPIEEGAVLPSLLSAGFDTAVNGFYDPRNQDFYNVLSDLGLNRLTIYPGTNANFQHFNWGMGFTDVENDFWNANGNKASEVNYSTVYNGVVKFHTIYMDLATHLRRPVLTYNLNILTQRQDGTCSGYPGSTSVCPIAPVPTDSTSIQEMVDENMALLADIHTNHQNVVIESVQLGTEISAGGAPTSSGGVSAFLTPSDYVKRVLPLAQAIRANHDYDDIHIQLHIKKGIPSQSDYGADSPWNRCIKGDPQSSDPYCQTGFSGITNLDFSTYLDADDIANYDANCDPGTHPGINIFNCFRDYSRSILDGDSTGDHASIQAALDSYTNYFGPNHKIRISQWSINNFDGQAGQNEFTAAAFGNTIANAAFDVEYLFKIAKFNASHNNIIGSLSTTNFSGFNAHPVGKVKHNTRDDDIPSNELYNTTGIYANTPIKLTATGLSFKLIKEEFTGDRKILSFTPTIPSAVPTGQLQVYGFSDIPSGSNTYYFVNWSNQSVALPDIDVDGVAIDDPNASLSVAWMKGEALSSAYGAPDSRNPDTTTWLTDNLFTTITPVSSCTSSSGAPLSGTDCITLSPFSITRIQGLNPNNFAGNLSDDTTPPSTPQSLVVQSTTADSATLSWLASTDDTGVDHYTVYEVTDDGNNPVGDCDSSYTDVNGTLRYCNEIFTTSQVVVTQNIQYSSIAGTNLLFNLYTPPLSDNVHDRALWVFLHGGGGTIGDGASVCNKAARLGYVCISGDYRSGSGNGFSIGEQHHAVSDLDALIRYARIHADEYGIDPNKLLLTGVSAGSITSLQTAITGNDQNNQTWFPTNDNLVNRANPTYPDGSTVPVWSCMAKGDSGPPSPPANSLIDANDPPIALFLGGLDLSHGWTCDTGQTVIDIMNALGIPSYFQCFPESGHGLGEGEAIDAVTIPMAYREVIAESCPQEYSNLQHINFNN